MKPSKKTTRLIVHMDMDAFFASVEQLDFPEYREKPLIVGADPKGGSGRGVVSTCSYEARRFGVRSAMPISRAYKLCPQGIFVRGRMKRYQEISEKIFEALKKFTDQIQKVSVDEAFLDMSGSSHLFGSPEDCCQQIKDTVFQQTGLTCSIGLAPNKMTAKIASDLKKPNGLVIVREEELLKFLWPLDVSLIWGLGKKSLERMHQKGVRTIGDLAKWELADVIETFGNSGASYWLYANGYDDSEVRTDREIKSVSHERTFDVDTRDEKLLLKSLMYLSEKTSDRLRKKKKEGRTISLKLRYSNFDTLTRDKTLKQYTNYTEDIFQTAKSLLEQNYDPKRAVRLIGVRVAHLRNEEKESLLFDLDEISSSHDKEGLYSVLELIKGKFGEKAIYHASGEKIKRKD